MRSFLKSLVCGLLALALIGPVPVTAAEERPAFSDEELDQMLAPIALYPDSLLSQVLMASTYPLEVVQAARWSRSNAHLKGDDAVKAVENMDWDPSVKSLVAFPQILQRMDERLDWTQRLGEAFLAQEPHVLDTIQGLRQRAAVAGNLNSNEQLRVTRQDEAIIIEPARPEAVYVPYYNPAVVYGPWAYPAYPPVYWAPFPGYYAAPAFSPAFFWGPAIVVSTGFFFGHANWHHHHVAVHPHHPHVAHTRYGKPIGTPNHDKPVYWQHDPKHRKGVPYRQASLRDHYGRPGAHVGDGRRNFDGRRDNRGPGSAPTADRKDDGQRQAGGRDGRPGDQRRDSIANRNGQGTPQPAPQGSGNPPNNGRGNSNVNPGGSRQPGSAAPSTSGGERRSDGGRDRDRGTHQAQRPDNKVLRFPTPQAGAGAPAVRNEPNGNNVHRFQGHVPAPRTAPAQPAVRPAPQRSVQPAPGPQQGRPPVANRGAPAQPAAVRPAPQRSAQPAPARPQAQRPAAMPTRVAPPQAQARGHAAPRMAGGNGKFSGGGGRGGNYR